MAALKNPHPGDILKYEFLDTTGLSQNRLAHAIGVTPNPSSRHRCVRAQDYRRHRFASLPDSSVFRRAIFFRLQNAFDMLEAKRRSAREIGKIKPFKVIAA